MNDQETIANVLGSMEQNLNVFSDGEKQTLADIMYWAIARDDLNPVKLSSRFRVEMEHANTMIQFLINKKFFVVKNQRLVVTKDIPADLMDNLKRFYDEELINNALKGVKPEDKREYSNILSRTQYLWFDLEEHVPENSEIVAIRVVDQNNVVDESRVDIEYSEAVYLARYTGTDWKIEPPYLAYDLGGMTKRDAIVDDERIKATHWAEVDEVEIERWKHRFDVIGDYALKFETDKEHREAVYKALSTAGGIITSALSSITDPSFRQKVIDAYQVVSDIQNTMDIDSNKE